MMAYCDRTIALIENLISIRQPYRGELRIHLHRDDLGEIAGEYEVPENVVLIPDPDCARGLMYVEEDF